MRWLKRLAVILILALITAYGGLFAVENDTPTAVDLLFFQLPEVPLAIWILLAFAAGGLGGLLAGSVSLVRARSENMLLSRKLGRMEQELNSIRTSALKK